MELAHPTGSTTYSPVCQVRFPQMALVIWPNPVTDQFFLRHSGYTTVVTCYFIDGKHQELRFTRIGSGMLKVNTDALTKGIYIIQVNETSRIFQKRS